MALRILSGLIIPKESNRDQGEALIEFFPHQVTGDVESVAPHHKAEIGPNKEFEGEPCKMVPLREITVRDTDTASSGPGTSSHDGHWELNDEYVGTDRRALRVRWHARRDARIHEISYMVIGVTE